jgi:hypothetical protein
MSKPHVRNQFDTWEPVRRGRTLTRLVGKRARIRRGHGSQWEKGGPQPGQKVGRETGVAQTCKEERKGNGPYQGPLGANGEITIHKETRIKRRTERGGVV